MINKIIINSIFVGLTVFTTTGWAECTKDEAIQAETAAATLRSWNEIHSAFKKFSHCDDGAIAEGYSESVSQMLANHWDQLSSLEKQIKTDQKFEDFIIRHINQTIAKENAIKIVENAHKRCPKRSKKLCKKIETAAK